MLSWTLWLTAALSVPLAPCGADSFEPNDERRKARLLTTDSAKRRLLGPIMGASSALPAFNAATCEDDEDWYRLPLDRGAEVTITLSHHPTAKISTPKVFKPGGRKSIGKVERSRGEIKLRFRATRRGDHRLRIVGADGTRTTYSVTVSDR